MKKLIVLLLVAGVFTLGFTSDLFAQEEESDATTTEVVEPAPAQQSVVSEVSDEDALAEEDQTFHQVVKEQFLAGGWEVYVIGIGMFNFGLAIAIERIITLNLATTNTKKLLARVDEALSKDGVDGAKEVCKNTRGPVASIFTQGLLRMSEGVEMVEKSIIAYGSVEMGRLERGLVWISLFISIAPMLGFMGTVLGMIDAFDKIAEANDINPALVADGIKIALLTTVGGLIVAVILQLFYNYCVSKIDSLVNQMEDASISLVDLLVKHNLSK
jgi:biopolymer transport protein ExbB